jgi:hypothetical protein
MALEGHDVGPLIPHLLLTPLVELKSSRKMAFTASTVVLNKKPGACTKPLTPMLACGDISLPAGSNISNGTHSVFLGMSDFDIGLGWYDIGTAAVVDALCLLHGARQLGEKAPSFDEFGPTDIRDDAFGIDPFKMALGAPVSFGRSVLVSWHNDWTTPVGVKFGMGGGGASASKEVYFDPKTKALVVKDSQNVPGLTGEDWYAVGPEGIKRGGKSKRTTGDKSEANWGTPL